MIIERPYDELKAIKSKMREISRNLLDLEIIVSNMQDHIVYNLETMIDDLQRRVDGQANAEQLEKILLKKEK